MLAATLAMACAKKPSPEYEEAADRFSELYRTQWDDAYLDPEMDSLEAKLQKVPSDSLNAEAAQALLKRIREGRARMQQEAKEREEAMAEALRPTEVTGGGGSVERAPAEEPAQASAPDAGMTDPQPGMELAEFQKLFGGCFRETTALNVLGKGPRPTWALRDLPSCRDRHPLFVDSLLVFDEGRLYAMPSKSNLDYRLPDGGKPSNPPGR